MQFWKVIIVSGSLFLLKCHTPLTNIDWRWSRMMNSIIKYEFHLENPLKASKSLLRFTFDETFLGSKHRRIPEKYPPSNAQTSASYSESYEAIFLKIKTGQFIGRAIDKLQKDKRHPSHASGNKYIKRVFYASSAINSKPPKLINTMHWYHPRIASLSFKVR